MSNQYDNPRFTYIISMAFTILSLPLIALSSEEDQQKRRGEETISRRALNTNESTVIAQCAATLKELRDKTTPAAAEKRLIVVARIDSLRHAATLPALQTVAQDEYESLETRASAVRAIARTQDTNAVDVLINLISIPHPQVYSAAIEGLENVTGVHLGNAAYSSQEAFPGKRAEMRQKWQAWWKTNSTTFKPREDAVFWHRD